MKLSKEEWVFLPIVNCKHFLFQIKISALNNLKWEILKMYRLMFIINYDEFKVYLTLVVEIIY